MGNERIRKSELVRRWEHEGVAETEIDQRLAHAWLEEHQSLQSVIPDQEFELHPGASTETVRHPTLKPDGDEFIPVTSLYLPPGKYTIKASWYGASESIANRHSRDHSAKIYSFETAALQFEVIP